MAILLESVEFGQDNSPRSPLAPLSLKRGQEPRGTAVWRRNPANRPEDSPIVIIRDLLPLDEILVTPLFRRTAGEREFRWSVSCTASHPVAVTDFGIETPPARFAALSPVPDPNIGKIDAIRQVFDAGSDIEAAGATGFTFDRKDLERVSCRDITLSWTMTDATGGDLGQDTTRHRLYVILAPPSLPWSAAFEDRNRWLWPEVLDIACNWARDARTVDDAAEMITAAVFELGKVDERQGGLRYNGFSRYARAAFACSDFLDHLTGKTPSSRVNCSDLATIVSTFANALGCRLYQAQCGKSVLAPGVQLIGAPASPPASFGYHEVVWDGSSSDRDRVWDACLAFGAQPPAASGFGAYAQGAFVPPPPLTTGPLYTTNRPVKPRPPLTLTGGAETRVRAMHPELEGIVPGQEQERVTGFEFLTAALGDGAEIMAEILANVAPGRDWSSAIEKFVRGETAFQARYSAGDAGAADIRVSMFKTGEEARRFILSETANISEPMVSWEKAIDRGDFAIGTADGQTLLVKLGRVAITARVSYGEFNLIEAVRPLSALVDLIPG